MDPRGSLWLLALPFTLGRRTHGDFHAILQPVKAAGRDFDVRVEALHGGVLLVGGQRSYILYCYRVVGFRNVDEVTRAVVLDRWRGDQGHALQHLDEEARVDELVGKEREVLVGNLRSEAHGSRSRVHLVVERRERTGLEVVLIGAV